MSDETVVDTTEVKEPVTTATTSTETAEQKIARLEAEAAKNNELLEKLRRHEKANSSAAKRAEELERELTTVQAKHAELEIKVRNRIVDSVLEKALVDAKAKAPSTALKLIDKAAVKVEGETVDAKSVEALIKALKESDPILFDVETETKEEVKTEIVHPKVKAATEGEVVGGFSKELAAAKSTREIEAVMRKYGKMA